jgi:hypothetical protein
MADLNPKQHPTEDDLELFSMGRLARHKQEPIEEHLLVCESCRKCVEELDQYTCALRTALRQIPPAPEPSRRTVWAAMLRPGRPAFALMAVCAVLLVVIPAVRTTGRTAQSVELVATRGGSTAVAHAGSPLELHLRADGLESNKSARIDVVDGTGEVQWTGTASLHEGKWLANVSRPLRSGSYFVRAYGLATSELLREYPLVVQ